ncbi:MAG: DNA translocase FtsK [Lentimicrobiaceae bacterium]|nr:DNA translocase FtsK [Lentimicrobiaceae bacterium]
MPVTNNQLKKNTFKNELAVPAKPKKKKTDDQPIKLDFSFFKDERFRKTAGVFCIFFALFILIAFVSYLFTWFSWDSDENFTDNLTLSKIFNNYPDPIHNWAGRFGAVISYFCIKSGFGIASLLFVPVVFFTGMHWLGARFISISKLIKYSLFGLVWISCAMGFIFPHSDFSILGGVIGIETATWLHGLLGKSGSGILIFFLLIAFLIIVYNVSFNWLKTPKGEITPGTDEEESPFSNSGYKKEDKYNTLEFAVKEEDEKSVSENTLKTSQSFPDEDDRDELPSELIEKKTNYPKQNVEFSIENYSEKTGNKDTGKEPPSSEKIHFSVDEPYDPTLELCDYQNPPLELLDEYSNGVIKVQKEELEANKNKIVETLSHYAIGIDKIKATIGPTVTLYEIIPTPGVRISRIKNLEDDIALSLSALGIRIIAPIPGKGTIGIEVPNQHPEIVSMRSILSSEKFVTSKYELPFGIGKTIANEAFVVDLTRLPHILMAGATGQGKSVGLNAIITSLLYKKHPSQLKFVMVDPKKVELTLYSKIERHYLAKLPDSEEAIITDTRQVVRTLNSLGIEMDNRYDLLKDAQVRNIKEYNTKFLARKLNPLHGHRFLPYIVLVIDEFADLIMTSGKEIEVPLTRLAQLARAVGIHLVIATQRPSVNIITGSIKANFPARIAFRVISKIDSRTILDSGGADQLVGRGDMLLSTGSDLIRLQCAFVDTHEVERVTEFIGSQRGYPDAFHLPEYYDEGDEKIEVFDPNQRDELFEDAARLIVQTQQGSTSLLQRKLKLGYNRAGRIIDQLEAAGIVGQFEGSKPREVKISTEFALEQFLKDLYSNNQ